MMIDDGWMEREERNDRDIDIPVCPRSARRQQRAPRGVVATRHARAARARASPCSQRSPSERAMSPSSRHAASYTPPLPKIRHAAATPRHARALRARRARHTGWHKEGGITVRNAAIRVAARARHYARDARRGLYAAACHGTYAPRARAAVYEGGVMRRCNEALCHVVNATFMSRATRACRRRRLPPF